MDSKKKTIAFFLPSLGGAGAERNVINLISSLDKNKYKIFLVLGSVEGVFREGIPERISIIKLNTSNVLILFFKLIEYFRKEQPDIFISSFPHINSICLLAKIISGANSKIVITEHTLFSLIPSTTKTIGNKLIAALILPYLIKIIYPKADSIICVSESVAKDLSNVINDKGKIRIIYNPVTDNKILKLAKEPIDNPFLTNSKIPVIASVGRLVKAKDYPNLLKAFNLVVKKQPAFLIILGEGPEEQKIKIIASKLGISKNLALLGFKKNPYKYIKKASIFVLSSFREGFGNAVIEAMACGTPVVATNGRSGTGEIIENGKNGVLVPISNPEALAGAILEILNNPSLSIRLSSEGRKRSEYFSIEKSVKKYEEIFDKLIVYNN